MVSITDAKRLVKRLILSNLITDKKNLAITPLVVGKHGIGKSALVKELAEELNGVCITIEGGTLKEGEITGLPYQYKDDSGKMSFKFLPYYAVERIQLEEEKIFHKNKKELEDTNFLIGNENKYAMNDIGTDKKIELLTSKKIKPVIIFIDEINRTENTVYKELMNILLTRSVNGYVFPWWVFFVGAMNPSTQNSVYATNEMDPAQLDRFVKIKVKDNANDWLEYAKKQKISDEIINFIKENPKCISSNEKELDDEEKPTPSPRGWDMFDTILKSAKPLEAFFSEKENDPKIIEKDIYEIISSKLGSTVATMFKSSLVTNNKVIDAKEFFDDDEKLSKNLKNIKTLNVAKKIKMSESIIQYLKENLEFDMLNKKKFEKMKKQLKIFIELLDQPSKLLFAQRLNDAKTNDGNMIIELLFDVFEKDILNMLELSEELKTKIKKQK